MQGVSLQKHVSMGRRHFRSAVGVLCCRQETFAWGNVTTLFLTTSAIFTPLAPPQSKSHSTLALVFQHTSAPIILPNGTVLLLWWVFHVVFLFVCFSVFHHFYHFISSFLTCLSGYAIFFQVLLWKTQEVKITILPVKVGPTKRTIRYWDDCIKAENREGLSGL